MDETKGHERHGSDHRSDKPDTFKKPKTLADMDTKSILWIIGVLYAVLNGYILYRFSEEFTVRFDKHISPVKESVKVEQDYIKRDLGKIETKQADHEKRIRDVEVRLGGRRP